MSSHKWQSISKALLIVLIVKAAVAPHSNITSYLAVSFQAVAGAVLYSLVKSDIIAATLLGVLAMVESAMQKLIVWTIIFGQTVWEAIDEFGFWLERKWDFLLPDDASHLLMMSYLILHVLAGIVCGIFASRLIRDLRKLMSDERFSIYLNDLSFNQTKSNDTRKGRSMLFWLFFLIPLVGIILYGYLTGGLLSGIWILVRTVLVIGILYYIVGPLLLGFVRRFLLNKSAELNDEVDAVKSIIPHLRHLLPLAWKEANKHSGKGKVYNFILFILLYTLRFKSSP